MGSSIFISISIALVIRETRVSQSELIPNLSPFNEALRLPGVEMDLSGGDPQALARMSAEIARQATMIGYIDGFVLFAVTSMLALPLIALVRRAKPA